MIEEGRIIAIGDIHGCSVALATLIEAIQPTPLDTLVFLGDYIDRGPNSRGVIEQVIRLFDQCQVVPLLGNHEELLLHALSRSSAMKAWLTCGGMAALASYGYNGGRGIRPGALLGFIPSEHRDFIRACRNYYETVGHIFAHAYYEPGQPLHQQQWDGLRWASLLREPKPHCSGKVAIVGHTAQTNGEILDLGCVKCIDTFCHGGG